MNCFSAIITSIETDETGSLFLLELDASGLQLSMLLFDLKPAFTEGSSVNLLFKETGMAIARNLTGEISFSNQFSATVTAIRSGNILADITLASPAGKCTVIVTIRSVQRMKLDIGDSVTVLLHASQISLETPRMITEN
ncbi:MAG: TOBE domain-containing protein [Chlorobium limicola]|jgi:molybdate transport system regulatory protein|nr:TOBE domain-containing protein [Chlorobium limicola]